MSVLKIEKLNSSDWKEYLNLRSQLGNFEYKMTKDQFESKYNFIKDQNSFIYVGKIEDNIVCTGKILIEIKFGQNVGHIEDVVVDKNYRKKGYGKKIVNYLIKVCGECDCYKTVLQAVKNNELFYKKCGFSLNGIHFVKYYI